MGINVELAFVTLFVSLSNTESTRIIQLLPITHPTRHVSYCRVLHLVSFPLWILTCLYMPLVCLSFGNPSRLGV